MSVFRRKDKKLRPWLFKISHKGEIIKVAGFATRKDAQEAEAAKRLELMAQQQENLQTPLAFAEIVNKRLTNVKAYCTEKHLKENIALLRRFADWWELPVDSITKDMIRDRLFEIADEKSNNWANRHLIALKSVFELAVKDEMITRNPCRGIDFLRTDPPPKFIPSKDQISQILLLASPLDRAYLTTIWLTVARVREVNNLTWEDVDFERRTIRLWTRKKRGGRKTPRFIDMADKVYDSLKYAWKHRDKTSPWVFTNPKTKKAYDYRDKLLHNLCRKAGVPEIGYHNLRHHAASAMADANVPITAVQAILGHESITTTTKYLHALGVSKAEGIKTIEGD